MARRKKNVQPETVAPAAVEEPTSTAVEELSQTEAAAPADTVMVGLNRAQGIIYRMPDGRNVEIAGNSVHLRGKEMGNLPVGAFGLTTIKREDWEWIQKTFGKTALFKSGRIFASSSKAEAKAEAAEKKDLRNGLEPAKAIQTEPDKGEEEI